jgi:protein tyrosine/serine phosphatase
MRDKDYCDRCDALILTAGGRRPTPLSFVTDVRDDEVKDVMYEEETRILCESCEDELLDWIDSSDIDRSDCVDLPTIVEAAEVLHRAANTLEQQAGVLERELEGEEEE